MKKIYQKNYDKEVLTLALVMLALTCTWRSDRISMPLRH